MSYFSRKERDVLRAAFKARNAQLMFDLYPKKWRKIFEADEGAGVEILQACHEILGPPPENRYVGDNDFPVVLNLLKIINGASLGDWIKK